jgi:hypothetical protein
VVIATVCGVYEVGGGIRDDDINDCVQKRTAMLRDEKNKDGTIIQNTSKR